MESRSCSCAERKIRMSSQSERKRLADARAWRRTGVGRYVLLEDSRTVLALKDEDPDVDLDLCGFALTLSEEFAARSHEALGGRTRFSMRNGTIRLLSARSCLRIEDYASVELLDLRVEGCSECMIEIVGCGRSVLCNVGVHGAKVKQESSLVHHCVGVRCERRQKAGRCRMAGLSMLGCQVHGLAAKRTATGVSLKGLRCVRVCGLSVDDMCAEEVVALVCSACSNGAFDSCEVRNLLSSGVVLPVAGRFIDGTVRCEIFDARVGAPLRESAAWHCSPDSKIKFWKLEAGCLQLQEHPS